MPFLTPLINRQRAVSLQSLLIGQKHFYCSIGSKALQEGQNKVIIKEN